MKDIGEEIIFFPPYINKIINTLKKQSLKITQLEKVYFIKVNELKLTQVELF